jgi:ferritin
MEKALDEQINAELYSAYFYLSMVSYFESISLSGFASWMKVQVQEELSHADKFMNYIHERGGKITFKEIESPKSNWKSPLEVFKATLKHEQYVTSLINNLVGIAISEKDYATQNFLQWYVSEQVEEESSVSQVVEQLKLVDKTNGGIFMLDRELAKRVFTPPAQ